MHSLLVKHFWHGSQEVSYIGTCLSSHNYFSSSTFLSRLDINLFQNILAIIFMCMPIYVKHFSVYIHNFGQSHLILKSMIWNCWLYINLFTCNHIRRFCDFGCLENIFYNSFQFKQSRIRINIIRNRIFWHLQKSVKILFFALKAYKRN